MNLQARLILQAWLTGTMLLTTVLPIGPLASAAGRSEISRAIPQKAKAPKAQQRARYDLSVSYQPEQAEIRGRMQLTLPKQMLEAQGERLYFRLYPNVLQVFQLGQQPIRGQKVGGMQVEKTWINGREVTTELLGDPSILSVPLSAEAKQVSGSLVRVEMDYRVQLPRFPHLYQALRLTQDGGTAHLMHWYPTLAVRDDQGWHLEPHLLFGESFYTRSADFRVSFQLPRGYRVVSTGADNRAAPRQKVTVHQKNVRDFVAMLTKEDYRVLSGRQGGTRVNLWYPHERAAMAPTMHRTALTSLGFFTKKFGAYPYKELDVVLGKEKAEDELLGLEYPGLVSIAASKPGSPSQEKAPRRERDELIRVVAHEVAHQWWYGLVGNNQGTEGWLDEGLTTFATELYMRDRGRVNAGSDLERAREFAENVAMWKTLAPPPKPDADSFPLDSDVPTARGALMLVELADKIGGVDKVTKLLRTYHKEYQYKIGTTADFIRLAQRVTGQNLDAFIRKHVYPKGGPRQTGVMDPQQQVWTDPTAVPPSAPQQ